MPELRRGQVIWANLSPDIGSEQAGHRPVVIISSDDYLASIPNVFIALPVTTRDRGLPNHVRLGGNPGLDTDSFAMTEQPRTIDRRRITGHAGHVDEATLQELHSWLIDFLGLAR